MATLFTWGLTALGAGIVFFFKTINMRKADLEMYSSYLPNDEKYRRFRQDKNGEWIVKGAPTGICPYIYETAVVLWDGSLLPCCFDGEERIVLGNAFDAGLYKAWNSRDFRIFRYTARHNRTKIPICSWCPEARVENMEQLGRFWTELE